MSTCKHMSTCSNAEEAEARPVLVGLYTIVEFFEGPIVLDMDYHIIANEGHGSVMPLHGHHSML